MFFSVLLLLSVMMMLMSNMWPPMMHTTSVPMSLHVYTPAVAPYDTCHASLHYTPAVAPYDTCHASLHYTPAAAPCVPPWYVRARTCT